MEARFSISNWLRYHLLEYKSFPRKNLYCLHYIRSSCNLLTVSKPKSLGGLEDVKEVTNSLPLFSVLPDKVRSAISSEY